MEIETSGTETCFVIAPIDDAGSEIRKRSDQVLKHVIEPAAEACHLKALRADKISEPGAITTQVIKHIIQDAVIVADLTGHNPNVFYELAVCHAFRRPFCQIIQKGERLPFDVIALRTIEVDLHDPDMVVAAKEDLRKQIEACRAGAAVDNPISVATELEALRKSQKPQDQQLAEVLAGIAATRSDVLALRSRDGVVDEILRILRSTRHAEPRTDPFRLAWDLAVEAGIDVHDVQKAGECFFPNQDVPFEVIVQSKLGKEYRLRPAFELTPNGMKEAMKKDLRRQLALGL